MSENRVTDLLKELSEALEDEGMLDPTQPIKTRFVDISRIPLICASVVGMAKSIEEMRNDLQNKYVTKERYLNVERVVFGLVTLVLTSVAVAILARIFR